MNSGTIAPAQPNGQKRDPPPPGAAPLRRLARPKNNPLVARKIGPTRQTAFRPPKKREDVRPHDDSEKKWEELRAKRAANGGWSSTPDVAYKDFPVVTTKRALREGIRYHVMRFSRTKDEAPIDPTDQDQFPRPVSLHRRDPRAPPPGRVVVKDEPKPADPVDEAEAERQRVWKEQKEAQRAADQAQIAPVLKTAEPKSTKMDKKQRALQTYHPKRTEEAKKASGIRYEETLPWHLEDVEGKNVWVGSYVAALSEVNVAFVIDGPRFRMIPLERYYKFSPKPQFKLLSLEQAERIMGKTAADVDRWVMQDKERNAIKAEVAETRKFLGGGAKVKLESNTSRAIPKSERRDDNDIDLSGDEFQDDDENPGFDADDEETEDTKDRLRRDHLGARAFEEANEDEVEKEAEMEKLERLRDKLQGKKLRKALVEKEGQLVYESDSDSDNPFQSSSESETDEQKDKDKDKPADDKAADQKDKLASGTNTQGNTTPNKQKAPESKKVKSLKRPASPNASESSGNESSRKPKKAKKNLPVGSANASRSGTPMPTRPKGLGGAASDGEATAGEGSDVGLKARPKKIKLKTNNSSHTPLGSRASSPAPPAPAAGKSSGVATHDHASKQVSALTGNATTAAAAAASSSASSPRPAAAAAPKAPAPAAATNSTKPITGEEIVEIIRSNGGAVSMTDLFKKFKPRLGDRPGQISQKEWVALVKQVTNYKDRMFTVKTQSPPQA